MNKKEKQLRDRLRKGDEIDRLYLATLEYVESRGGKLLVTGPIRILRWDGDSRYKFGIEIRCVGNFPDNTQEDN